MGEFVKSCVKPVAYLPMPKSAMGALLELANTHVEGWIGI